MQFLIEDLVLFIYTFVFCFLGAFSKDMLDTFLDNNIKVLISKVLISALAVTVILYGTSEYLMNRLSYKAFTAICYIFGLVSFEVLVKYSSIKDIGSLIKEIYIIKFDKIKDKGEIK